MFVFNTTFVVNTAKFELWETWIKNTYLPLMKNLVPASEVSMYEVMSVENAKEKTVSVQWKVVTPGDLEIINKQSPTVLGQMSSEFGQDALFFSTILKELK